MRSTVLLVSCGVLWACGTPPDPGTGGGNGATGGGVSAGGGGGGGGGPTGGGLATGGGMALGGGTAVGGGTGVDAGTEDAGIDAGVVICQPSDPATCASPLSVRTCNALGTGYVDLNCSGGRGCVVGTNGVASCQCVRTGTLGCFSNDVYEFDSCGDRLGLIADCVLANEESCLALADGARCSRPVTCTSDTNCAMRDHCVDGACVPDVCNSSPPGDRNFCNGEVVTRCAANGSGFTEVQNCALDGGRVCTTLATTPYADCRCRPNARQGCFNTEIYNFDSCGTVGTLVRFCTAPEACVEGPTGPFCGRNTACTRDTDCLTGEFCGAGVCTTRVCTPGAERCVGTQAQVCDARGTSWEVLDDCVGGEACSVAAGHATCGCTPNARQVCAGNTVRSVDSCGALGAVVSTCAANQVCSATATSASCVTAPPAASCLGDTICGAGNVCLEGLCALAQCTPNASFCAEGAVRRCDSRGATSQFVADCVAGEVCLENAGVARCACVANARTGCFSGDVFQFDSCGNRGQLVTDCGAGVCVPTGELAAVCASQLDAGLLAPDAGSVDAGGGCTTRARTGCYLGDLWSFDSCGHLEGVVDDCPGAVTCNSIGGPPACRSSVENPQSPFWSRACPLVQDVEFQTVLDADCRCFINRAPTSGITQCVGLNYVPVATRFGSGPTIRSLPQAHFNGGVIIGREVFVGVDWSSSLHPNSGLVMAIHLDTGARRIISGAYDDAMAGYTVRGTGPALANVVDVQGTASGLFALSVGAQSIALEIHRIDVVTGDRTVVWRSRDSGYGQCASGDPARATVTYHERVFGLDANGDFILAFRGAGPYSEGVGLVRITASGAGCSFVTRSGAASLNQYFNADVGGGPLVDRGFYSGFAQQGGAIYVLNDAALALFRVDPMTGQRTRVSSASTSLGVIGAGPTNLGGIGQRWLTWDSQRNFMWATGVQSYRALTAVDLSNGDRTEATCRSTNATVPWRDTCLGGVLEGGFQNFGGFWLDPMNGDPIVVHENHSLVRVDLRNGNSVRFSQ